MDLVSTYLGSSLLQVTRLEIERFLADLRECIETKRDPFFTAELGFDENVESFHPQLLSASASATRGSSEYIHVSDQFSMVPGRAKFVTDVMNAINNIRKSIINASKLVDFEGSLHDLEIYGFKIIKPKEKLQEEEELKELRNKYVAQYDYETIINGAKVISTVKRPVLNKEKGLKTLLVILNSLLRLISTTCFSRLRRETSGHQNGHTVPRNETEGLQLHPQGPS